MGNSQSIRGEAGLSKAEYDRIERRLLRLSHGTKELTLTDLKSLDPRLRDNTFLSRIFDMYRNADGYLASQDVRILLETLTRLGSDNIKVQAEFAYHVMDRDGDGYIGPTDLYSWMKERKRGLSSEKLEAIVAKTIEAHDFDGDGLLNLEEFAALLTATERNALTMHPQ